MEKAKQNGAPPPATRSQPTGDLKASVMQDKALPPAPQHGEQARTNVATAQRPQEDLGRPVSSVLHNTAKALPKRPLQQDADEHPSRSTMQRNPASYQHNDAHNKRRKTGENFDDDVKDMTDPHLKMTAPPIRQSSSRPKVCFPLPVLRCVLTFLRKCLLNHYSQAGMPTLHNLAIFKGRP